MKFLPCGVRPHFTRESLDTLQLYAVRQRHRRSNLREPDKQPPGCHPCISNDPFRDRVDAVKIEQQPSIHVVGGEDRANGIQINP